MNTTKMERFPRVNRPDFFQTFFRVVNAQTYEGAVIEPIFTRECILIAFCWVVDVSRIKYRHRQIYDQYFCH